jgi:hypothetical protein
LGGSSAGNLGDTSTNRFAKQSKPKTAEADLSQMARDPNSGVGTAAASQASNRSVSQSASPSPTGDASAPTLATATGDPSAAAAKISPQTGGSHGAANVSSDQKTLSKSNAEGKKMRSGFIKTGELLQKRTDKDKS